MSSQKRRNHVLIMLFILPLALGASWGRLDGTVRAQSEESVVAIVNARNPTNVLPLTEAKKLFMGQTSFWHGVVPVKVLTRADNSAAAKAFFALLGLTPQSFHKQWDELQLAGRGVAPKSMAGLQEAAQAVSQSAGAVSFALASEAWELQPKGVKVIPIR